MIHDTITAIEQRLEGATALSQDQRAELSELLRQLRIEASTIPVSQAPAASHGSAVERLNETVTEFETSHPRLVEIANRISTMLANMGI